MAAAVALSPLRCRRARVGRADGAVADFTLANGLELVVIPDHRAPVVTHMIWYKVGAADETPGKSGLAHFLEHLMFKGTAKNPTGHVLAGRRPHRRPGKRLHLERLHRLLPARAERPAQDRDGVRGRPHDRPAAHRRRWCCPSARSSSRSGTSASATIRTRGLGEQIDAALFLNHPYGKPVIGWRHEMEQLSRDDAHRLLPALLRAQRRGGGDRRRRRAERGAKFAEETYGKVARHNKSWRASARRSRRRWRCAR